MTAWLVRALFGIRLVGAAGSPRRGACVYMANHHWRLDAVALAVTLPGRPVVLVPREETRSPLLRWLLRLLPHEELEASDPASIRRVLRMLAAGRSVALFPGARLSAARSVTKIYGAPALIALRARVPVVPVRIDRQAGMRGARVSVYPAGAIECADAESGRQRRAAAIRQLHRLMQDAAFDARPRVSLFEAFLLALKEQGRRTDIIEDMHEEPRSYGRLLKGSLAVGKWAAKFTARGENVGVLMPNVVPTVGVVLGLASQGRVPAMLNYTSGAAGVDSACIAAAVRTVITSRGFVERARLAPVMKAIARLNIVYLEDLPAQLTLADKLWLAGYALWFPRAAARPAPASTPAVVLFTSGSEARPKGVALSHEAIIANIWQIRGVIDFTPRDKVLNPLPVYHAYSFTAGMMLELLTGTRLFLYVSPLRYRAIPEIAYRRDCTYLFGTGTFLGYYARHANPVDFGSVRYVISGGEKLGEEVARAWQEKFGLRIYDGYGATECAPVISLATPQSFRPGAVGRLLPGMEQRIAPVPGIERGGVLHVRGPNVMLGYYRYDRPGVIDPVCSAFGAGWYDTGDVVEIDDEGFITIVGRVKRFVKVAGEMVPLDAIEEVARRASPAALHAAVMCTEAAGGETSVLFTTDPGLTRAALLQAARDLGLQDLAAARRVVWLHEIPLLGNGKTDYVTLQARARTLDAAAMASGHAEDRGLRGVPAAAVSIISRES